MTPAQAQAAAKQRAQEAIDLRAAGLSWLTIARRLGCSASTARQLVVRELAARGKSLAPPPVPRSGRPAGSRSHPERRPRCTSGRPGRPPGPAKENLFKASLARAWRSRGWGWDRIAEGLGVAVRTLRDWCR
jgi:hypothetical protein